MHCGVLAFNGMHSLQTCVVEKAKSASPLPTVALAAGYKIGYILYWSYRGRIEKNMETTT